MSNTQKLPADLTDIDRFRLCWRVAKGMPWTQAVAMEGLSPLFAETLAQDEALLEQVESLRKRSDDPLEERQMRLVDMAINVLETHTLLDGHDGETVIAEDDLRTLN